MGEATIASWALPVLAKGYEHREEIKGIWQHLVNAARGKKTPVALTGMAGAGKTVLFDHLTGKAHQTSYRPPDVSYETEHGLRRASGKRISLAVIPGQDSEPRHVGIEEVFEGKHPPHGVIHVVCFGFAETRNRGAIEALIDSGLTDVASYREAQMEQELEDLRATCELVRRAVRGDAREPSWLLVAVAKADLFVDELEAARKYYRDDPASPFVRELLRLQGQIGSDNLRWDAAPVSAWPENFTWNQETVSTKITTAERNGVFNAFASKLESYCAR